jgi:murein DD-endopeptidase MepM/ murein hydrolase activator NlpD
VEPRGIGADPKLSRMPVRQSRPKAHASQSHFEIVLSHRSRRRSLLLPPSAFYALVGLAPILGLVYLAVSLYLVFHDDMLTALMNRASAQQYAYEDRIATLRTEINRMTLARQADQTAYEGKIRDLVTRQARLEQHAATITALADRAGLASEGGKTTIPETNAARQPNEPKISSMAAANALDPLLVIPGSSAPVPPATVSAFAPINAPNGKPAAQPASESKPRPLGIELRSDNSNWTAPPLAAVPSPAASAVPIASRLGAVSESLDRIETTQMRDIAALGSVAHQTASKLRGALARTGLVADHLKPPPEAAGGIGGPFIPVTPDTGKSPFERAALELQDDLLGADRLKRLLPYVPLRQPITGALQVTSPFGTRVDPFLGRLALHPGVDLRQNYGNPVLATAAGKVTIARRDGGYGNMVEIDHGNGLMTRYGHLSTILVTEGQRVEAGEEIGKVGSTGRSTGPHLHYEVRIDGEPVDPMRFLNAGTQLARSE